MIFWSNHNPRAKYKATQWISLRGTVAIQDNNVVALDDTLDPWFIMVIKPRLEKKKVTGNVWTWNGASAIYVLYNGSVYIKVSDTIAFDAFNYRIREHDFEVDAGLAMGVKHMMDVVLDKNFNGKVRRTSTGVAATKVIIPTPFRVSF